MKQPTVDLPDGHIIKVEDVRFDESPLRYRPGPHRIYPTAPAVPTYEIITVACTGPGLVLPPDSFGLPPLVTTVSNHSNRRTPCQCYQDAFTCALSLPHPSCIPEILIYIHDDVTIHDPNWLATVLDVFSSRPACAIVGLGGATSLGREGLYKRPYQISDMSRGGYASNQRDWQVHGGHLSSNDGPYRVVVVDAFFMAVRTSFLGGRNGWPSDKLSHHALDLWLACEAARAGAETWAVGVDCTHHGGGTSTNQLYRDAKWLKGGTMVGDHEAPHKWLWQEYRDVLPIKVQP